MHYDSTGGNVRWEIRNKKQKDEARNKESSEVKKKLWCGLWKRNCGERTKTSIIFFFAKAATARGNARHEARSRDW
jgi:hypothetical protein